ncbi:sucrose synthase [Ranunculus cassubicifolius]
MNSGLVTFATNQGGLAEIIVDGVSRFHIDPKNGDEASNKIASFFEKCKEDPQYWNRMSMEGLRRIYKCYTWEIYANKVLNMGLSIASGNYRIRIRNKPNKDTFKLSTIFSLETWLRMCLSQERKH